MTDQLDVLWDEMCERARLRDDFTRDRESSWVPPILHALVTAARSTTLRRFHPFTSHAMLRFATSRRHDEATIAPGLVSLTAAGTYEVWDRRSGATVVVSTTNDPVQAAAALEWVLAGWH
ncbi:hypothetical protein ABH935_003888 [Catenulispora sp. GAS73]|uniref:DUF6193 family natural product biosynthesis protein n=1 Tax=Catenulispora sp. GAS73 TaxID=3156269 RepID=UPI0035161A91